MEANKLIEVINGMLYMTEKEENPDNWVKDFLNHVKITLEEQIKKVKQKEYLIRDLEGCLGWHIEACERYEKALKQIQNNYKVEDVDYIPITGLFEIQLIIKNALEGK